MTLKSMLLPLMDETAAHDPAIDALIDQFEAHFAETNVPVTPFVALQVHDLLTQYRIARAIEQELFAQGVIEHNEPAPVEQTESGPAEKPRATKRAATRKPAWEVHPAVETLGKTWDRFRKALKELQDLFPKAGDRQSDKILDEFNQMAGPATKAIERARKEWAEARAGKEDQAESVG